MPEDMEYQPVRIAPAKTIAIAHGYWPPVKTWETMQGAIIRVKPTLKHSSWWDASLLENPVPYCEGECFSVEKPFTDERGKRINIVCEHQILAD